MGLVREALAVVRLHRLWTALTMFGIVWGTASLILLIGWGVGVQRMVEEGVQKVGKNLVVARPGRLGSDLSPAEERRVLTFHAGDVDVLRSQAWHLDLASAEQQRWMNARIGDRERNVDVRGVEPSMAVLRDVRLAAGRFITDEDIRSQRRVAVIGQEARKRLLGPRPAMGARVALNGFSFEVVGLLERVGAQLTRDESFIDEQVWVPITTTAALGGSDEPRLILVRPRRREDNERLKGEVRRILSQRLRVRPDDEEAVQITSQIDLLAGFDSVFVTLRRFLTLLAATTLTLGGMGVLNMMLISVNERRGEIGVRLAVGARRSEVVGQFVLETLVIVLAGGLIGIGLGVLSCRSLALLFGELAPVPVIVPGVVVTAISMTVFVGLAAATLPAWQAAQVDPAKSLRAE